MGFFTYFKALTCAPRQKTFQISTVLSCYIIWVAVFFSVGFSLNGFAFLFAFFAAMLFMMGIFVGNYSNNTPNLINGAPLSHGRKTLYRFLSPLWMTLLEILVLLAFFIVLTLIIGLIAALSRAGGAVSDAVEVEEEAEQIPFKMGVYGGIFGFLFIVIMYSCGMIFGFIKKQKNRNIFMFSLAGAVVVSGLLMSLPYASSTDDVIKMVSPFVENCYQAMALPWLCITVWALLAAFALGAAIYMGIKSNNPERF